MNPVSISVSVLNMDFTNLSDAIREVENTGIESLHLDIMDGNFVDNISFGPDIVQSVNTVTSLPLHTHLMIKNPAKFVGRFFKAGSDTVTLHIETLQSEIDFKLLSGKNMGISLNPDMPVETIYPYLDSVKRVLIMSVEPGFGGQKFIGESLNKISQLRKKREETGLQFTISVDGGIDNLSAPECIKAGVDELVVGAYITRSKSPATDIRKLRKLTGEKINPVHRQ